MENYIDIDNLNIVKNKIDLYRREEEEKLQELIGTFSSMNNHLNSTYSLDLEKIQEEFINKMKLLRRMHLNDVLVLEENIGKYQMTIKTVSNNFDDVR